MITLQDLIADPQLFPSAIYADRQFFDCHRVDRTLLAESAFLDQRMTRNAPAAAQASFSFDELEAYGRDAAERPVNYIFHSSFCRSTLMAQALHVDGVNFSLKEPMVLHSLAESCRYTASMQADERIRHTLNALERLLSGLVRDDEQVLIKPTNFANNLLPYAVASGHRILLMYSDLESYLVSILKYGEQGRAFARQLFTRLRQDCDDFRKPDIDRSLLMTDLMIAALTWKQQVGVFIAALEQAADDQVRTLNSTVFADQTEATLAAAADFFGIGLDAAEIAAGPVFRQHSKSGKAVDNAAIQQQKQAVADKFRGDLDAVMAWAGAHEFGRHVRTPLPSGLLESG